MKKGFFQALLFSVTNIDTIAVISIYFDVSLCCTSHPSGSRLVVYWRNLFQRVLQLNPYDCSVDALRQRSFRQSYL